MVASAPVGEGTPWADHRFIFIGGVHRSGTSYTARVVASNSAISAFQDTGVQEDEGEHLQSVYPHSWEHGGMTRFAFRPEMHLTETSPLVSDRSRALLWEEWGHFWDRSKPVLLEKSPPNLMKMRFLQALFPRSAQVLVIRHPVSVVLSSLKWRTSVNGLFTAHRIIDHWLAANAIALADAPLIQRLYVMRYEDLVADQPAELARLSESLELSGEYAAEPLDPTRDARNFDEWRRLTERSRRRAYFRWIERRYESRIAPFGYSFHDGR